MWKCPKCGEQLEDAFDSCWKCAGETAAVGHHPALLELRREPSDSLSLEGYLALVQSVPLPTPEQRQNFIKYVSRAHSWYKHLPAYLPGVPFYFFIDRFAGCDRVVQPHGTAELLERKKRGFHYADLPTQNYRANFGFLNYACAEGVAVVRLSSGPVAVPRDKMAALPGIDGQMYFLPEEIINAGRVELTAIIHPLSPAYDFWDAPGLESLHRIHWPAESGGQATLRRIFIRAAEMRQPEELEKHFERIRKGIGHYSYPSFWEELSYQANRDPILYELMEPERLRQEKEILNAIDGVCRIIMKNSGTALSREEEP